MARARFALPEPPLLPQPALRHRLRGYLIDGWPGRVFLGAVAFAGADLAGVPLPCAADVFAWIAVVAFSLLFLFRLGRYLVRRLLWRIRTKMIVSYLFIAVAPVVLLSLFFVVAAFLGLSLVASYMVSSQVERSAEELRTIAQITMAGLRADDPRAAQAVAERLTTARALHPSLSHALVIGAGRPPAAAPITPAASPAPPAAPSTAPSTAASPAAPGTPAAQGAPTAVPVWFKPPGFSGLVQDGERQAVRALWTAGGATLILDLPVDRALFADLESRTGIRVVSVGGRVKRKKGRPGHKDGVDIDFDGEGTRDLSSPTDPGFGSAALTTVTHWETGAEDLQPMVVKFEPQQLVRRLSPGSLDMGDVFVRLLAGVGGLFLILYFLPLLLGLLLARSITKSIHELSRGTERLRVGDFSQAIPIHSRDQLGELAYSFNGMARSLEELLHGHAEKERLEEELRIARQIQMSLLPQSTTTLAGLRVAALCLPAAEVGGDYYDLLPLSETRMGVLIADVSGKGTSAALYMAELKGLVLSLSRIYESPARLLSEANRILSSTMDSRSFITMTYAMVDTAAGTMRYARAGHNPIIHLEGASGRTRVLTPQGLGLGIDRGDRFDEILEEAEVPLTPGDLFLFFTDGLSEAMNDKAELFGERRLRDVVEAAGGMDSDASVLKDSILAEIRAFVGGAAQHDDMTMVLLKVL